MIILNILDSTMNTDVLSPDSKQLVQAPAYVADERVNNSFMAQESDAPVSNCAAQNLQEQGEGTSKPTASMEQAGGDTSPNSANVNNSKTPSNWPFGLHPTEPCFIKMSISDKPLLQEILALPNLPDDAVAYMYYMTKKTIDLVRKYLNVSGYKADYIYASDFLPSIGSYAHNLAIGEYKPIGDPNFDNYCDWNKRTVRHLGEYNGAYYHEFIKDCVDDDGSMIYPAGIIGCTVVKDVFPDTDGAYEYRELLDPDNYLVSHDYLDFVNRKLHEAFPDRNLWAVALDLDSVTIFDLDKLPHLKRY